MPALEESRCPACGANVFTTSGTTQVICSHCGTPLTVERDQGEVILHGLAAVTGAVREEGQLARENLRRIEMGQHRAQLAAELAAAQQHKQNVNAEVRGLERMKRNNAANWQLIRLRGEGRRTKARIKTLTAELRQLDAALAPPTNPQRVTARNQRGCLSPRVLIGIVVVLLLGFVFQLRFVYNRPTTGRIGTPTVATASATQPPQALLPPTAAPTAVPTPVPTDASTATVPIIAATIAATVPVAALPTAKPTVNPADLAPATDLKTYLDEGFVDATWYRHIVGVAVVGNLIGVQTDYPAGDVSRRAASPICSATSGFAIERSIPGWEILVYSGQNSILIWRHSVAELC